MLPGTRSARRRRRGASTRPRAIGYPVMLKSTAGGGGIGMRLCASTRRNSADAYRSRRAAEPGQLRHRRAVPGEVRGERAPHRGADLRRRRGQRDRAGRTRLFGAAPQSEGDRGDARARACGDSRAHALLDSALRLGRGGAAIDPPARWSSSTTTTRARSISSKSTRACRWSTASPKKSPASTWWNGWCGRPPARCRRWTRLHDPPAGLFASRCASTPRIPPRNFQPSAGQLSQVAWPRDARVETWVESGTEVTPYYDPMLAKIIVHGRDRAPALARIARRAGGVPHRRHRDQSRVPAAGLRRRRLSQPAASPPLTCASFRYRRHAVDVVEPRHADHHSGLPGPARLLARRRAAIGADGRAGVSPRQRLVGNPEGAAGLEIAVTGPTLRFACDTVIALTGADFGARLDGQPVPRWQAVPVKAGSLLELGSAQARGSARLYRGRRRLRGARVLGSRSTFILGKFGGHAGRVLRAGDVLHVGRRHRVPARA